MQVSVEKTSELTRKMTVTVPEEVVQEKIAARLKSLAREVKIDGFRPGKVPQHVINKMYGDRVRAEIADDLIKATYYEALQQEKLTPASHPHIHSVDQAEGFKYTAEFEVYPEIVLDNVAKMEVSRPVAAVQDVDVDEMIERLRGQKKTWTIVERVSQDNDRMTISFSGIAEDRDLTDGKIENYQVICGANQMITGFEENLLGLEAGANKSFQVQYPEAYGDGKLAGKIAEFEVDVISIEEPVLPEIDEDFIKACGLECSLEDFREKVRGLLENELEQALRGKLKDAVMDSLYEKVQIPVPNALVDQEVESLMKPHLETAKRQKIKPQDLKIPRDVFEGHAKRRVALGLILDEIIRKNTITLDDDKVRAFVADMAKNYERPKEAIDWYFSDQNRLKEVRQMVLEEQVVDWLLGQSTVSDAVISFTEAMTKQA